MLTTWIYRKNCHFVLSGFNGSDIRLQFLSGDGPQTGWLRQLSPNSCPSSGGLWTAYVFCECDPMFRTKKNGTGKKPGFFHRQADFPTTGKKSGCPVHRNATVCMATICWWSDKIRKLSGYKLLQKNKLEFPCQTWDDTLGSNPTDSACLCSRTGYGCSREWHKYL